MHDQGNGGMGPTLSIVVPCYNEAQTLRSLHESVVRELEGHVGSWELILIDDGSRDATRAIAAEVARSDQRVRALGLSRNFGKEAAMYAGLRAARGDYVILMDADLQHPPALIPEMIEYAAEGWDQVIARRTRAREQVVRKHVSRLYYRTVNRLMDVRLADGAGDFRLMSRRCVDALLGLGEAHRFSKGMFAWVGFPQMEIQYENVLSERDESSWTMRSLFNYGLEGLLSFNTKPLRLAIWTGAAVVLLTVAYAAWILVGAVFNGVDTPGYVTTIAITSLIGGVQLITLGIIGEYVGRIFNETKRRPIYLLSYDSSGEAASPRMFHVAADGSLDAEPEVVELTEIEHRVP
ncbi:glycosyltransferase family 2 protein [Intrasporangium sp. YIM S08009]|uniref:glycosyltransferase family 2 protein n=1 Tax=Intrasporangium zincisolvens TaxID=3080018 RepID=UPI002B054C9F|nr:glycosyltransferase family 2 protein [Intrasporangium sp. YIM S08009]